MNDEFMKHAESRGDAGKDWLAKLPQILQSCAKNWNLKILDPFKLNYNYVAPVIRSDGTQVVLKIGYPKDQEFQTEIEALMVYNGEGIEKLLEVDRQNCAILIERVTPGTPLSSLEDDEKATRILASVMKKLWKPLPLENSFITIAEWTGSIPEYQKRYPGKNGPLPSYLVDKAGEMFEELIATSADAVLVHGDLHHDNVLTSNREHMAGN